MVKIAREVASEADLQMRMQGIVLLGAFLKLTPYAKESEMSDEQVYAGVEKALRKYFGKRGDRVVQDNLTCVRRGYSEMKEIPRRLWLADHEVRPWRRTRDAVARFARVLLIPAAGSSISTRRRQEGEGVGVFSLSPRWDWPRSTVSARTSFSQDGQAVLSWPRF